MQVSGRERLLAAEVVLEDSSCSLLEDPGLQRMGKLPRGQVGSRWHTQKGGEFNKGTVHKHVGKYKGTSKGW